jgi:hypothetical protein
MSSWNIREPSQKDFQKYYHLVEIHSITDQWLVATNQQIAENPLKHLSHNLPLESILQERSVRETLAELDLAVQSFQLRTLQSLLEHPKPGLSNLLEQTCWRLGRQAAEKRWPAHCSYTLSGILLAFRDTPFYQRILVRRLTDQEAQIEVLQCPHRALEQAGEHTELADILCSSYFHWMRGYCFVLNSKVCIQHEIKQPHCIHKIGF